jgi:hypothetical protein
MNREKQFDEEDNLLEEKPLDANEVRRRKKIAAVRNKVEDLIQRAKNSDDGIDFLMLLANKYRNGAEHEQTSNWSPCKSSSLLACVYMRDPSMAPLRISHRILVDRFRYLKS